METRNLLFSTLFAAMMAMMYAQPQYRVSVDAPAITVGGDTPEETLVFTLCFREAGSTDMSTAYCPLGLHEETLGDTAVDPPPEELALRDGADMLPAAYPTAITGGPNPMMIFLGVGVLVTVERGGTVLGSQLILQANGSPSGTGEPGTVIDIPASLFEGVVYTARFMINCIPEFTGPDCTTPVQLATMAPPTTMAPPITPPLTTSPPATAPPTVPATPTTMPPPTTAAPPITAPPPTTTAPPTTTVFDTPVDVSSTGASPATTVAAEDIASSGETIASQPSSSNVEETASDEGCPSPALLMGIGIAIGFGTATLIALLIGTLITTCCLVKMGKKRGSGASASEDDDEIIKTTSNPLYGAELEGHKRKTEHHYDEVQYQGNSSVVPHPESHGGFDEDHSAVPHPGDPESHYEVPHQQNHNTALLPGGHSGYDEVQNQQAVPLPEVQCQQAVPRRGHSGHDEVQQQSHRAVPLQEGRGGHGGHGKEENSTTVPLEAHRSHDETQHQESHSVVPLPEGHSSNDENQHQEDHTPDPNPYEVPLHSVIPYPEDHGEEGGHAGHKD